MIGSLAEAVGLSPRPDSLADHAGLARHLKIEAAIGLALACLCGALFLPLCTVTTMAAFDDTMSIIGFLTLLWDAQEWLLAGLVLGFSVLFPVAKLLATHVVWAIVPRRAARRWIRRLEMLAKWSMAEVFIVAVTIVVMKSSLFASLSTEIGLYLFIAAFGLSVWALGLVEHAALTRLMAGHKR